MSDVCFVMNALFAEIRSDMIPGIGAASRRSESVMDIEIIDRPAIVLLSPVREKNVSGDGVRFKK